VQLQEADETLELPNPNQQLVLTEIAKPIHNKASLQEIQLLPEVNFLANGPVTQAQPGKIGQPTRPTFLSLSQRPSEAVIKLGVVSPSNAASPKA